MIKTIRGVFAGVSDPEGVPLISVPEGSHDVRPVMDELAQLIRERKGTKPLVILTGEVHHVVSHVALPQIAMQSARMADPDFKIAHGIERSHNLMDILLRDRDDREVAAIQTLPEAYIQYENAPGAPVTRRNVMDYCLRHHIPVEAVDLAGSPDGDGNLDQSDPATRMLVEIYARHLLREKIPGSEAEGMRLRNIMAFHRIKQHISDTGADVYVAPYGGAHLMGWKYMPERNEGPFAANESLGQLFYNDPDIDVMIVFPNYPELGTEKIPEDVDRGLLSKVVVVDGLSPQYYWQKKDNPAEVNDELGLQEAAFLREMARQSGDAFELSDEVQHMVALAPMAGTDSPADWGASSHRYES